MPSDLASLDLTLTIPVQNLDLVSLAAGFSLGGIRVSVRRHPTDPKTFQVEGTQEQVTLAADFFVERKYQELIAKLLSEAE